MDDFVSCQAGLSPHMCDRLGTVYLLTCKLCGQQYVGESHRKLREWVKEHHALAQNRMEGTPWSEHLHQHSEVTVRKQPIFETKVISISKTEIARKFREAIEIQDQKPPINKSKGWVLTWSTYSCFWHGVHQVNVVRYGDIVGSKKFFFMAQISCKTHYIQLF